MGYMQDLVDLLRKTPIGIGDVKDAADILARAHDYISDYDEKVDGQGKTIKGEIKTKLGSYSLTTSAKDSGRGDAQKDLPKPEFSSDVKKKANEISNELEGKRNTQPEKSKKNPYAGLTLEEIRKKKEQEKKDEEEQVDEWSQ